MAASSPPSLAVLCLDLLSEHLDEADLRALPEHLVMALLATIVQRGQLTYPTAVLFSRSGHRAVEQWIARNVDLSKGVFTSNPNDGCRP